MMANQYSEIRISKFAHNFTTKDYFALFHSILFELIFIKAESISFVKKLIEGNSIIDISQKFPELLNNSNRLLFDQLIKNKFICSEFEDSLLLDNIRTKYTGKPRINLMYMVLTDECNFQCKYCFVEQLIPNNHKNMYMNTNIAEMAINLFAQLSNGTKSPSIIFYGGEPLLNVETFEYSLIKISKLKEQGELPKDTKISIVTNGSCITSEIIDIITSHNVSVSISLDGPQEIHDSARVTYGNKGTYKFAIDAIHKLKNAGINPGVSCTISKYNYKDLEAINSWLVNDLEINGLGYNLPHSTPAFPDNEEITRIASKKLTRIYESNRKIGVYEDRMMRKIRSFVQKTIHPYDCAGCGQQLVISPDGDVGVCHAYLGIKKYFIGQINSLIEFHPEENSTFLEWSNRSPLNMADCIGCPALGICGGGCPANADFNNGSIWSIDKEYCSHSKQILEWIISDLFIQINYDY